MSTTYSQNAAILEYLQTGEGLTPMDALQRFGVGRLAARIADLKAGALNYTEYDIQTFMVSRNGKRFAEYRLMSPRLRIIEQIPMYKEVEEKPSNSLL